MRENPENIEKPTERVGKKPESKKQYRVTVAKHVQGIGTTVRLGGHGSIVKGNSKIISLTGDEMRALSQNTDIKITEVK